MKIKALLLIISVWFITICASFSQQLIQKDSLLTRTPILYARTDFIIDINTTFNNPFNAEEIALDMMITTPGGKLLDLPCFYFSCDTLPSDNAITIWNARFTPQQTGIYHYYFLLKQNNIRTDSSVIRNFNVAPSALNGIIHPKNNWEFIYDSGTPFRGVGEDLGWEGRSFELQTNRYNYFLPKLSSMGVNFFRTWMCAWNLPVEWKNVTSTNFYNNSPAYFNPGGITRMDQLTTMCDSLQLHMQLVLTSHDALITNNNWPINNYNQINGGPVSTPTEFFTQNSAKQMFKNRLRYMIARWGYSPSIGAWEMFNEVDNISYGGGTSMVIPDSIITNWHTEMCAYLKSIDIYQHLVTTSISYRNIAGLNSVPSIDYNQQHIYDNTNAIEPTIQSYESAYSKPYVIGEFAWDWNSDNIIAANSDSIIFDWKRGMWYGLFTSTPIVPMTWWWEFIDGQVTGKDNTPYYQSITDISQQMLQAGSGSFISKTVSSGNLESYALECGQKYFVYCLNGKTGTTTAPISLQVAKDTIYKITSLVPSTHILTSFGNIASSNGSLRIGTLTLPSDSEMVFIVSLPGDKTGELSPFLGTPANIPGSIAAVNFDYGGEGVAYHDASVKNISGYDRPNEGVDIDTIPNGYVVTNIESGEWLKYAVQINTQGKYNLTFRAASADTGSKFRIILGGMDITGPISIPNTGSLSNYQNFTVNLIVPVLFPGIKEMQLQMESNGFNLDSIRFNLINTSPQVQITSPTANSAFTYPGTITVSATAIAQDTISKVVFYDWGQEIGEADTVPYTIMWKPSYGTYNLKAIATDKGGVSTVSDSISGNDSCIWNISDTILAVNYNIGGEMVGYYTQTQGNEFGFYRHDGVGIEQCDDIGGGYDVGDFMTGEWLQYTVNATQGGLYTLYLRVASLYSGTELSVSIDGTNVTGNITVPNTGEWETWTTISKPEIQINPGKHVVRLTSGLQYFNTHFLVFQLTTPEAIPQVSQNPIGYFPNPVKDQLNLTNLPDDYQKAIVTNLEGLDLMEFYNACPILDCSRLATGVYVISLYSRDQELLDRFKIIKFK